MDHLSTTLRLCREHGACGGQYKLLTAALGPEWGDDQTIPLTLLLDLDAGPNWDGPNNTVWAFRAVPDDQSEARDRAAANFSAQALGRISGPSAHAKAVHVLHAFAFGQATDDDVVNAAKAAMSAWKTKAFWRTLLFRRVMSSWDIWLFWDAWAVWNVVRTVYFAGNIYCRWPYRCATGRRVGRPRVGIRGGEIASILRDSLEGL